MAGRIILWVVALALAGTATVHARTLKEIRDSGTLRICVAGSSAPFYQANAEMFARFLGVHPEVTLLSDWDRQFHNKEGVTAKGETYEAQLLADGSCDIYPNDLHVLDWRESKMLIVPYYTARNVIIAHRELRASIKSVADLAGRSAAVQKGTAYDAWLQERNANELAAKPVLITYASTADSMRLVAAKDVDFTLAGSEGAFRWARVDLHNLDILFPVGDAVRVGWGIRPSARDLREQLERFFADSRRVGSELDRAWLRQHGISHQEYQLFESSFRTAGIDLQTILAWAVPIGSSAAAVLVAMLFWNRRLKRAREALHASNERLELAQEAGNVGVFDVDVASGRDFWTPQLEAMFGLKPGTYGGTVADWAALLHPDDRDRALRGFREALQGKATEFADEFRVVRPDGSVRWFESICRIIRDPAGRPVRAVGVNIDVTEILTARRTAEEATRAKSMFLASMSHEIRTPMNGVLGMLEVLALAGLDPSQRTTLEIARESARSLLRIIDDILDFSKIEAGKLDLRPEPTSIARVVDAVHGIYAGIASGKDLVLRKSVDAAISPALMVDPLRLRQILNNFVSNGIKFTQAGHVEIRVERVERSGDSERLRFVVADTGIGVAREARDRLFQPFVQAESDTTRRFGGTGLGLTICRRLAEMMGGTIEMDSEPGWGTRMIFTVSLPVADPRDLPKAELQSGAAILSTRRKAPTVEEASAEGTLVLLVDDHSTNRALLLRQLNLLGYAAESAENGREALERWHAGSFAAVITDCNMPEMDGYELTRHIRGIESRGGKRRTPIIACTANALTGDAEACLKAGMDDFVPKPVALDELAKVMDRWLPLRSAGADAAAPRDDARAAVPVDHASLAQISGGDTAVEREILVDFRTANDADAQELRQALSDESPERVTRAAHRMKGACRMIGAMALAEVCERLETAGRQKHWELVVAERGALERELERLEAWLSAATGVELKGAASWK